MKSGKMRVTVVVEWPVSQEELAHYGSSESLEEAAEFQQADVDNEVIGPFDLLEMGESVSCKVEAVES